MLDEVTTSIANSNIAIIKYWGKRDEDLILPTNSSISFTMDEQLSTTTSVKFSKVLKSDKLILDGKQATEKESKRVVDFLNIVRKEAGLAYFAEVVSQNSFPKAAGLASSASGFAALAHASLNALAGIKYAEGWEQTPILITSTNISMLARRGSGSATRSIYGGAVEWQKGSMVDGSDSYAVQLSDESNWENLRNVIAIFSSEEKKISSRAGMAETVKTSKLFKQRLVDVDKRLEIVRNAIKNRDFSSMAKTIMEDSDNMHAVMADTSPPIVYMNETSNKIKEAIIELNEASGSPVAAYTFDAGPNANIYTTQKYEKEVLSILNEFNEVERIIKCKIGADAKLTNKHLM